MLRLEGKRLKIRTKLYLDTKVKDMVVELAQSKYTTVSGWISEQIVKEYQKKFVKLKEEEKNA